MSCVPARCGRPEEDVTLTSNNGGFGFGEDQSSGRNFALTAYNAGFGFGWEIDFWGKFRRSIEAADAGYFASIAQYDDLQVLMAAQAANFYCAIRTIELRLKIAHENAALQKRSLEITERLFKHGNESELDVQQAKAQYLGTLSTIPQLEGSLRQNQNALGVLLARPPGPLPEIAEGKDTIPQAELGVIVDLPADLLRRRPDVRAVEMQLAAQSAQIGVKEADFYPSIALARLARPVGHLARRIAADPCLGHRSQPRLERLRSWPADRRGAGAGRTLPATLRAVSGCGIEGSARGR